MKFVAVWTSTSCVLASTTPLLFRKSYRWGICSRSLGTFGLSLVRCTLSNWIWMTCLIPFASWQLPDAATGFVTEGALRAWAGADTASMATVVAAVASAARIVVDALRMECLPVPDLERFHHRWVE